MRLRKGEYRRRDGTHAQRKTWLVIFTDHEGIERSIGAFGDRTNSRDFGRQVERLADTRKAGDRPDAAMRLWIENLPAKIRERLARLGLIERRHLVAELDAHLADFEAALTAKGTSARQAEQVRRRAARTFAACRFKRLGDLHGGKVEAYLAERRAGGLLARGAQASLSAQTSNFYLQACKQFCRWCVRDGRMAENPLAHLAGVNVRTDRRHDRRALTADECRRVLAAATAGKPWRGIGGADRAILYRVALETGLRAGELRSLTRADFDLDASPPTVTVRAAYSKHRREDRLPLRADLAEALRVHLRHRLPGAAALPMPSRNDVVKMLRADLAAAGVPYQDEAGRFADFHALRHTFVSNLAASGVHPKVAQTLARHSTITLTMDRYSHTRIEPQTAAVEALPDLGAPPRRRGAVALAATGTDGGGPEGGRNSAPENAPGIAPDRGVKRGVSGCRKATNEGPYAGGEKPRTMQRNGASGAIKGGKKLARPGGFEPPTYGFVDRHSILLS